MIRKWTALLLLLALLLVAVPTLADETLRWPTLSRKKIGEQ